MVSGEDADARPVPAKIDLARQRYQAGQTVEEIAAGLGVSRATVYRHLETSRSDA